MNSFPVKSFLLLALLTLFVFGNSTAFAATPQISGGSIHTIALHANGTVWTWGGNTGGQLGIGEGKTALLPVRVPSLSNIDFIAASGRHNLAVQEDGTVWSWGDNSYGQVGQACSTLLAFTPMTVPNIQDVVAVSGGEYSSLALKSDGTVWAWGRNEDGELGIGTSGSGNNSLVPVQTHSLFDITALSSGYAHSLALKKDGTVWAWGSNSSGQLGNGSLGGVQSVPAQIPSLNNVIAVASRGSHSTALKNDGTVWTWGSNSYGQLGIVDSTITESATPVQVTALKDIVAITAGSAFNLALKSDGTVMGWGYNGQFNFGESTHWLYRAPTPVQNLTNVEAIGAGTAHSLFLMKDGSLAAAGANSHGQLGDGNTTRRELPVQVKGLTDIIAIAGGKDHSLALKSDGSVWSWGYNYYGHLGNGSRLASNTPVQVHDPSDPTGYLTGVNDIAAGSQFAYALKAGTVMAWGSNGDEELGQGGSYPISYSTTPRMVQGLTEVTAIAAGNTHGVALSNGNLWAWGRNDVGQLGDDTTDPKSLPNLINSGVADGKTFVSITAGYRHNLAIVGGIVPTIASWGWNYAGQLGNNTENNSLWPIYVQNLTDTACTEIAAGTYHSLARDSVDGRVWAWGQNYYGQLGVNDNQDNRLLPVRVKTNISLLTGVQSVAAGYQHSLALKQDGSVWSWGINQNNELGNEQEGNYHTSGILYRHYAAQVRSADGNGTLTSIQSIAAGHNHSLALKTDGTVWAWGYNNDGQLGDGSRQYTPVNVKNLSLKTSALFYMPAILSAPRKSKE